MSLFENKKIKLALVACASLTVTACDLGLMGSSPLQVHVSPPILEEPESDADSKPVVGVPATAKVVKGKPGYVYNPYTGNIVDVRGLAAGLLVRDPEDLDPTKTFYIP